ncbi:MAG: 50S ribosome-binding GTPase [Desulfovibrio sp.]|jgi:uncharacterized protein (DUF697 family)/GTP-binding protein EngB required for normal cell division|nr:50S ribosome-binding GTPase [Desulfovibrio sp.]MBQ2476208.1 50S ribosome-binding GTPase [Desulfovibrio sp.]MCR5169132.1 50S ribosome-binding GTPase [Desulfovibrio sp.]
MDISQYEGSFAGRYAQDFEELGKRIAKPRILVSGGTGVGKSTLVNLLFKREIAVAGSGQPVTRGIDEYQNEQCRIYDTEGYETGSQNQEAFKRLVFGFLDDRAADPATAVNAVWYCISAPSARVLDVDIAFIKEVKARGIPVACVLTQVDCATFEQCEAVKFELRKQLKAPAIFLSSIDEDLMRELDDGLDALFAWTKKALPESVRLAFVTAANRDIAGKAEEGVKIIRQHCLAAFATGFTPIPASDAPLLIAQQTALVARLTYLWRIEDLKDLISSTVIPSVLPLVGKTIAGNVLKAIPGLGSMLGGVINGSVAASITFGFGSALNTAFRKCTEAHLAGRDFDLFSFFSKDFLDIVATESKNYK